MLKLQKQELKYNIKEARKITPKNDSKESKRKNYLEEYEKIGNITLKIEKYGTLAIDMVMYIFLFVAYIGVFDYTTDKSKKTGLYWEQINPILPDIFFIILFILLILAIILMFGARIYENHKKYNINKIIRLYFYELSKNPDKERKDEIIRHLTYNLWRIQDLCKTIRWRILQTTNYRYYFNVLKSKRKLISIIIDKVINFLNNSYIYLENEKISENYIKIGDCFEKEDYIGVYKQVKISEKMMVSIQ